MDLVTVDTVVEKEGTAANATTATPQHQQQVHYSLSA